MANFIIKYTTLKAGLIALGLLVYSGALWAKDTKLNIARLEMALEQLAIGQYKEAADIWEMMANEGHAQAQFSLASSYEYGLGREQNNELALNYYRLSAKQGDARAMHQLALLYVSPQNTPAQLDLALSWWEKSAKANFAPAQYYFGMANYIGLGVEPNKISALKWIAKSKTNGYEESGALFKLLQLKHPKNKAGIFQNRKLGKLQPAIKVLDKPKADVETQRLKKPQILSKIKAQKPQEIPVYPVSAKGAAPSAVINDIRMIDIAEDHGEWLKIKYNNQIVLWVYGKYIDGKSDTGVVNAQTVRLRLAPSTNNIPVGTINRGFFVRVLQVQGDWKRITLPLDTVAWIKAKDIPKNKNIN